MAYLGTFSTALAMFLNDAQGCASDVSHDYFCSWGRKVVGLNIVITYVVVAVGWSLSIMHLLTLL